MPPHRVRVRPFCLDLDEVTAREYSSCAAAGRCREVDAACAAQDLERALSHLPRNCVTPAQAASYCASLGARLPTEVEWEYAARGGARGWAYPVGSVSPSRFEACIDHKAGPCDIRSYHPEAFGLHDLSGNLREWVADEYQPYAPSDRDHDSDRPALALARGGSWQDEYWTGWRSAARHGARPQPDRAIGFRCARNLEPSTELATPSRPRTHPDTEQVR